jgi:isopentenyl diphosphate isomerase/L-lactate dehydrogenase-like FMN-dependent dehydrogenase
MNLFGFSVQATSSDQLVTVEDYRKAARRRVPKMVWSYIDEGADDLATLNGNREAFAAWRLRSKILTGLGQPDLKTHVAGVPLSMPVLLAPTGFLGLAHWKADIDAARAAENAGTRFVVSTATTWSLEEIRDASPVDHFFQLYPREGQIATSLMRRAWQAGYRALMVTVDVPTIGNREQERRNGMGIPPVLTPRNLVNIARYPRWIYNVLRHQRIGGRNLVDKGGIAAAVQSAGIQAREMVQSTLNWEDLRWMRDQWKGHLFVKGILDPQDAEQAVRIGADGVVVSNHGGRQLDHALPSLEALPAVVAAVGGKAEILLDGGVRRGSDVIKAVSMGAKAVMIGRPYVYGATANGQQGVEAVLEIFRSEIERNLTLMGCARVTDLDQSWLLRAGAPGLVDMTFKHATHLKESAA